MRGIALTRGQFALGDAVYLGCYDRADDARAAYLAAKGVLHKIKSRSAETCLFHPVEPLR